VIKLTLWKLPFMERNSTAMEKDYPEVKLYEFVDAV
jgi:hypothetical protein